jgi:truncated hemoglobin YjbI
MVGGQQTVSKIVTLMYEAIPLDDILKDFFTNADMIRQIRMQTKFLTMVLQEKKPTYYQKVAMSGAHRHLRLRSHHFDRIKTIIESSMRAVGISIDLIEEALLSVEKFRSYIIGAGSMFKMEEEDNDALEGTLTVNSSLEKLD